MNAFKIIDEDYRVTLDFSVCEKTKLEPLEAIKKYIYSITETYPPPYTLFVSGGIDSQVLIQSFLKAGIPFNIRTIKFDNGLNQHDLENTEVIAQRYNLNIEYFNVDIIDFLENKLIDYVKKYQCSSPHMCAHINWVENIKEGTALFSGSPPFKWGIEFTQDNIPFYTYSLGKNLIPFFLLQDREVCSSFLKKQNLVMDPKDPIIFQLPKGMNTYRKKCLLYKLAGFDIIPQPIKYSGFELVKEYYDAQPSRVTKLEKLKFIERPSKRIFDLIFRYRMEQFVNRPRKKEEVNIPKELVSPY